MRLLLTTLLLLAIAPQLFALTLDEAINAALDNHQRIEQFRANADRSQALVGVARSTFLPSLDLNYDYLERDEDPYQLGDKSSALGIAASINLFNGLTDFHLYNAAKERAKGADFQLRGIRADITLAAKQAYIEVLRADRTIDTAEERVKLLERQVRDTSLKFEYGLIAKNDLLRVEVELSTARQQRLRATGNFRIAKRQLERTTGLILPPGETFAEQASYPFLPIDPPETDNYRYETLTNRSELNFLRRELQAADLSRKANKGSYLPSIDLAVAHEEYNDDLSPASSDEDDNLISLNASWNLFDGFAREKNIAASDAQYRAVAAQLRDTEAIVVLQLETALQNAHIARGSQKEAQIGVTQAEENYRVTDNLFQQQQVSSFDLLDAEFLLSRARFQEITARYDYYLSIAQLERILERETQ